MFRLLRRLGEHVRRRDNESELDQLCEAMGDDYRIGLAICFDRDGDFVGVEQTDGQDGIIYMPGTPNGGDHTLVSKKSSTVVVRLVRNASRIADWGEAENETIKLLDRCHSTAEESQKVIEEKVLGASPDDASRDNRVFVYWAIKDEKGLHPFCQTPEVQEYLKHAAMEESAELKKTDVRMHDEDGVCSVCGDEDVPVYGNFSDIACYNVDKPGFITGGFDYGQTTRNFPICRSCILDVRGGKSYVEEHLDLYGAGLKYWLLPDAEDPQVYDVLLDRIEDQTRHSLGREGRDLMGSEGYVLDYVSHALEDKASHAPVTLNFFFYETSNAAWRIVGEMRRVLPSRVTDLFKAKEWLETQADLPTFSSNEDDYQFSIPTLQPFCGFFDAQDDRKLIRYLEAIFQGDPLREKTVVSDLVGGILSAHKDAVDNGNVGHARYTIRDAWATYLFLNKMDAIKDRDGGDGVAIEYKENNGYTRYIEDNPEFFGDPERTAAFLTGCYAGQVMYAQHLENPNRDTQPFAKKFVGRKLDRDRLERLYYEGKDKLNQYERIPLVRDLDPVLAETWVQAGEGWDLSKEHTTFAFNLGWTLSQQLATAEDEADETENPEAVEATA